MTDSSSTVRVRFAPSPTGYLHIGGARTALYNYLFARKQGGVFVLRIEDTDRERSTPAAMQAILDGMRYLGLDWDEGPEVGGDHGPYFQSERVEGYRALVDGLLESGAAYRCFCSRERLDELRKEQMAAKQRVHYDRRCRDLGADDVAARVERGDPFVVRFAVGEGETVVDDLIRGRVVFSNDEIEDFIVQRADGTCVYNLAVVGDDSGMEITHVIRGEDHLTNTPKQILLFRALGAPVPTYAHIALIHGPGRQKLSKRHGAVSVTEYQEQGYLPEAMLNFLVRMGWSYDDRQEIFSREELVEKFSLDGISRSPAMYDLDRLKHLGNYYMRQRSVADLTDLAGPRLVAAGLLPEEAARTRRAWLERMVALEQERVENLSQIVDRVRFYFEDPTEYEPKAAKALRKKPEVGEALVAFADVLEEKFDENGPAAMEEEARRLSEARTISMKDLCQPMRAVLTGRSFSPPLFDVIAVLGREATMRRLRAAPEIIKSLGGGAGGKSS